MGTEPTQAGQDPAESRGQDPQGAGDPSGQDPTQSGQDPTGTPSPEQLSSELARARREAAEERRRRADAEKKLKEREDAELSELDKTKRALEEAQREKQDLERVVQEDRVRHAIEREAAKAGVEDLEAAVVLVDRELIEYDGEKRPQPKSVEKAVRDLLTRRPYLVRQGGGSSTSPASPARSTREQEPVEPGYERLRQAYAQKE